VSEQTYSKTGSLVAFRIPRPIQDSSSLGILQNQQMSPSTAPSFLLAMAQGAAVVARSKEKHSSSTECSVGERMDGMSHVDLHILTFYSVQRAA